MTGHLSAEPAIVERPGQPYVAIRKSVTIETIHEIVDSLPVVFGWLRVHGIEPAGGPFFRYNLIDMPRRLDMEAGVPVAAVPVADGTLIAGVLPAGRYVTATHVGHPDRLIDSTAEVLAWAAGHGLTWDMVETPDGERWACRLELYHTDPAVEPDLNRWETELAFRLAG
jgi:effector-binding domain-containing protein